MSDDWFWQNYRSLTDRLLYGGGSGLQPMTAFGRVDARLKDGDKNFARDKEAISDELTAALKRVAITSARTTP